MNKLMTVVAASVCAVSLFGSAFAAEDPKESSEETAKEEAKADAEALEKEEAPEIFEAGFDFDFFSAYVWRNAVQTDDMVMQPCVWGDFTYFEPFWLGFSIWQNYDLTDRRGEIYRYGLNETDYNVHLGATAWENEDGDLSFGAEIGHEWYTYHGVASGWGNSYPNTRELYLKLTFDNPIVNVYGQTSWMYEDFGEYQTAMHYEVGFNREIEILDTLSVGADWNVNFGNHRYLAFLYGGTASGEYLHDDGGIYDDYDGAPDAGVGGTTVKLYLTWAITDWCSLGATIAYTGLLNGSLRDSTGEQAGDYEFCGNPGRDYPRDLLWGGLSLKLAF